MPQTPGTDALAVWPVSGSRASDKGLPAHAGGLAVAEFLTTRPCSPSRETKGQSAR